MSKRKPSRLKRFASLLLRLLLLPFAIAAWIRDAVYGWRGRW